MSRKKVLLVDDSATALMFTQMLLGTSAYVISTARDGREAVQKATSELPDVILMDVVMPHMTGIEACRALRASALTASIPIILITTRGDSDSVATGFASGCNDYVTKPINGPELFRKLRHHLGE